MREMKFRAWDREYKKIGEIMSLVREEQSPFCLIRFHGEKLSKARPTKLLKISEFTGLKDKNGREIYEGDILKWQEYDLEPIIFPIKWGVISDCCVNGVGFNFGSGSDPKDPSECEIIGNVYENEDLLK